MAKLPDKSNRAEIDSFLARVAATPPARKSGSQGRLLFAMDATASRQPSWDRACHLQAEMFQTTAELGGLAVQLCFYRGYGEFKATPWLGSATELQRRMTGVTCLGGRTQILRVLDHAISETRSTRLGAVIFVGDAMEEDIDQLCHKAGELGVFGVPLFLFQEGRDPVAERAFRQMAKLTGGAWCPFDAGSAAQLKELLGAVAVYAAGGRKALEDYGRRSGNSAVPQITHQLRS